MESLRTFLYPKGIAIIGASASPLKHGGRRWLSAVEAANVVPVYPVNTNGGTLNGRDVRKNVRELPTGVDLAIVLIPAKSVPSVMDDCAQHGIKNAVIVSGGFGEAGVEGLTAERDLVLRFQARGGRILGPNCAGLFSAAGGVNALGWSVPRGHIGVIAQSGNVALTLARYARQKHVGFSSIIPLGNAADVHLSELVDLLLHDDNTHAILVYCEGFSSGDGRKLVEAVKANRGAKRIVMLKPGRSVAGTRAARSHTASIAGDDAIVGAALAEAGIVRANEIEEALDIAIALATGKTLRRRHIAVLSDGGGHATIVADYAGRVGLALSAFSSDTTVALKAVLPPLCGISNPVDFAGTAEPNPLLIARAVEVSMQDPNVGGVIFAGLFGGYHLLTKDSAVADMELDVARQLVSLAKRSEKPLIVHTEHAESDLHTLAPFREEAHPLYGNLESAAKVMRALLDNESIREGTEEPPEGGEQVYGHAVLEPEARTRLRDAGIAIPPWRIVSSKMAAKAAFAEFDLPVAMKLVSPRALHKSDVGGVVLNVASESSCVATFAQLMQIARNIGDNQSSVLMCGMVHGVEAFIGAKRDQQFGPVIFFGTGGTFVELAGDIACNLAPLDEGSARRLVRETKVVRRLEGYRGSRGIAIAPLLALLVDVSRYFAASDTLLELDLNPVIINEYGAHIVDVRLIAAKRPSTA